MTALLAVALSLSGCRDGDGALGPRTGGARFFITSDPSGARILVDGADSRQRTPDTVAGFTGRHTIHLRLDTAGVAYEYRVGLAVTEVDTTMVLQIHGPLWSQCGLPTDQTDCYERLHEYTTGAGIRYAHNPLGSLFLHDGTGSGAFWPSVTSNSYLSSGIPVFAALHNGIEISLGAYDHGYLAGRPAPISTVAAERTTLRQTAWVVPPTALHAAAVTVRGIEINEEVVTSETVSDVVLVRLTFRNITATREYRAIEPGPPTGITFQDAFIGLALDPDIGEPEDDWLSYDPDLDMAFVYDAGLAESRFRGGAATAPGFVGLRALRVPAGTTVMLNGWSNAGDWSALRGGTEAVGFGMLSGRAVFGPAHEHPRIGHLPEAAGDMRISVTAGPLTLAPGDQAEIVVAIAFASPAAGTYQSGTQVLPGDPVDVNRALHRIAAQLRERMVAAAGLLN